MTVPDRPALTPPAALDHLDALAAEASKAPWDTPGGTHDRDVIDDHGCHVAATSTVADAALIVAAVNHLPQLTAAIRAALTLADELDDEARTYTEEADGLPQDTLRRSALLGRTLGKKAAAARIREAITAALTSPDNG